MTATNAGSRPAPPAERLERHLRERAADGEFYFKSKFVADEVGLSPSEVGSLVADLRESATDLRIERWAYTNATTWRVAPVEEA
ncbi:MAG: hypothetical protein ABEJ61_08665 [Haloferacaceae archaeon]